MLRRESGYCYIWTLVTVAMIGIGLIAATDIYSVTTRREKEEELLFVGRQISDAIGRYYEATPGMAKQYPPSLVALLKDPRFPGVRRHLRRLYADPFTGKADWGEIVVAGRIVGVYSKAKGRPIKMANFEQTESSFIGKDAYSDWKFTYPYNVQATAGKAIIGKSGAQDATTGAPFSQN